VSVLAKRVGLMVAAGALVVVLATGSAWSASSRSTTKQAPKTLTVGIETDLTGVIAPYAGWQGAAAYFKALNARGGIHGVTVNYKLYDGGSNPTQALQATQRLLASHPVAFMAASPFLYTALPTVAKSGIPAIGDGLSPQWGQGIKTFFSVDGDLTSHLSDVWLRVLKSQGASKLALFTSPLEKGDIELMDQDAAPLGLTTVLKDVSLPQGLQSADALRLAQRVVQSGADGVLFFGTPGGIQVAVDLNQLGWKGRVEVPDSLGPQVLTQYGSKANGLIWAGHLAAPYATKAPGVREYVADMNKYGYGSVIFTAVYALQKFAEAKMLVEKGLTPCYPSFSRACIISHLSKLKNYTAGGLMPRTSFPEFQNGAPRCLSVAKIVNGKWVVLTNGTFPFLCGGPSKPIPTG
jgi:ABC-type branched-subunit amino acid transport system substrate-binding protein